MLISDKKDPVQRLLDKKRYFKKEINVALFEYCSNNCSFCFQGNDDRTNLNPIVIGMKAKLICDLIEEEPNKNLALKIFGGELFENTVKDEHIEAYKTFMVKISDKCKELGKTLDIIMVTNLLNTRVDRIEKLVKDVRDLGINVNLAASFDLLGRFHNQNSLDLFMKNVMYFKNDIKSINMVITKNNIDILLGRKENKEVSTREAFDTLYKEGFSIACDYYNPDLESCHIEMPSDTDLLDFYYYAIDNYPKIMPVNCWVSGRESDLSCEATIGISSRGRVRNCRDTSVDCPDLFWSEDNHKDNSAIENSFVKRHNCLTCKYYTRCTMGCFLFFDFKYREHYEECIFSHIFHYLETGEKTYGKLIPVPEKLKKLSQSVRRKVVEGEFELNAGSN